MGPTLHHGCLEFCCCNQAAALITWQAVKGTADLSERLLERLLDLLPGLVSLLVLLLLRVALLLRLLRSLDLRYELRPLDLLPERLPVLLRTGLGDLVLLRLAGSATTGCCWAPAWWSLLLSLPPELLRGISAFSIFGVPAASQRTICTRFSAYQWQLY